jgi:hypothetical protein
MKRELTLHGILFSTITVMVTLTVALIERI